MENYRKSLDVAKTKYNEWRETWSHSVNEECGFRMVVKKISTREKYESNLKDQLKFHNSMNGGLLSYAEAVHKARWCYVKLLGIEQTGWGSGSSLKLGLQKKISTMVVQYLQWWLQIKGYTLGKRWKEKHW